MKCGEARLHACVGVLDKSSVQETSENKSGGDGKVGSPPPRTPQGL
jgi:hypothetical protein